MSLGVAIGFVFALHTRTTRATHQQPLTHAHHTRDAPAASSDVSRSAAPSPVLSPVPAGSIYYAMIAEFDAMVGAYMDTIKASGAW